MQELSSAHHLKVLLVEDNSTDARLVEALLDECDDIGLRWATGLVAALAELRGTRFDAVLLDLLLPDARGADLISTIHAAAPEAALIVSSGQAPGDCLLAQAIIRKGAEDFLPKAGLTTALLARTLTTAVERCRARSAMRSRAAQLEAALVDARIGHLSWVPAEPEVTIAGDLAGLLGLPAPGPRLAATALLRRLSRQARESLYATWRELAGGAERLAVVLLEHDNEGPGLRHDLLVEAVAVRDAGGRIVRVDALVRDTAMIGHVERLEGQLITHLGHELRTPLTTIRGALGLLAHGQEAALTDAARTLIDNAIVNADRIGRVIGETLESAATSHQSLRFQQRRVPLGPYLYDALVARLPGAAGATSRAAVGLTLTPASRSLDRLVDAARLRRALDCLFARLATRAPVPDRLVLDVSLHGDVAWLAVETPGDAGPPACGGAAPAPRAGPRPAPTASRGGAAGLRIAVPLAA